jgi:hypothetical protein
LNVLDYLSEKYEADSTEAAILVGAHMTRMNKPYAIGADLATVYLKSDSPEDQP